MIYQLMKRDAAWKIAVFSAMLAVLPALATKPSLAIRLMMVAIPILFFAATARPQQRATVFQAALPLPARDLFLARLLSLVTIVWFPLAVYAAVEHDWSVSTLELAALLTLLVLLPLATRVGELDSPAWVAQVEWIAGMAIGGAGMYFLPPTIYLALCALAFAAVFLKAWTALPPSFQCAPMEAAAGHPIGISSKAPTPVWWILARQAIPWWALICVPLIWFQFFLGNILFAFCFYVSLYSQIRIRMRWMQALPVRRRAFLLFALVPAVLPMIVAASLPGGRVGEVSLHYRPGTADVRLPLELWRHAPGGAVPMVEAPWGETYRPVPERFLGYPLYNPFSVGPQRSTRFLVRQHDRAQDAVNTRPFAGARIRILYLAAISALSLGAVWLVELLYWYRFGRLSPAARSWVALAIFAPLFAIPMILDVTSISHGSGTATNALLRALIWRIAGRLPGGLPVVLAVAAIPTLFLLWLIDCQFRESESVDTPRPQMRDIL